MSTEPAPSGGRSLLVHGAPDVDPDLFHVIPAGIMDPFLYLEADGKRATTVSILDAHKVPEGIEVIDAYELGMDDLLDAGLSRSQIEAEISLRATQRLGIRSAAVPPGFPLFVADHLRAAGIELAVDDELFAARRRVKTPGQLEGIRRAQRAADAAMRVAADLVHALRPGLTSEEVRGAMQAVAEQHACELSDDAIVSHGAQAAIGHEHGHGEIAAGEPVIVDIWPKDRASRCGCDMTRTFVAGGGEPPAELAEYWRLARAALERVYGELRPGVNGRRLFELSCEPFHEAGQKTQLNKAPGESLQDGYYHALGHGVGLEVHERPNLGRIGDELVAGDVIAIEPGCYRRGFGGCRLEDTVLVTAGGYETLTDFPYDL